MKYGVLGKTGLEVSTVGVGAWQFGGEWGWDYSQADVDAIIDKAQEVGINLIDTAECYGDHLSEMLIGNCIAARGDRDKWIIATKFGHKFNDRFTRDDIWSPEGVRIQVEDSLKSLKTDYIDLLQFHSGNNVAFDTEGLWEMLAELVKEGKVRTLGISINNNNEEGVYQTGKSAEINSGAIQVVYNRLARAPEAEVLPLCQKENLGVLARVPLASGFLSGKYKKGASFGKTDVRGNRKQKQIDDVLAKVEEIAQTEVPEGVPMAQWALAWCLKHPAVTCVIPGCKNPEQVVANAAAADLEL